MASGTISGGNYNSIYSYYMTWTSVSNGSVANTSNVTLNWIYKKNASDPYGAYNTGGSSKVTLVINGSSSGSMRADFDLRSAATGSTSTIATYTVNNIPHNSDGTCTINVSGSHVPGNSWGTKSIGNTAITLDTIPRYATSNQSLDSGNSTETSLRINWSSDSTIDYVWYSKDGGSNWTGVGSVNASSGNYTISGLSAGTSYNIKTRVRRKDSQLTTDSSTSSWSTYSYPYISAVGTSALTIGNQQTLTLYNPKSRSVTVYMKHNNTSGTQIYSGSTSTTSIQFTPTASTLYNLIPNAKSGNCVYYVVYSGNTSGTKSGTFVVNENNNKPTVTSSSANDNNSTYSLTNDHSRIVLNATNMSLTINANAKNGATFNNSGYIKVNGTTLTLTISGSNASGVYNLNKPSSSSYSVELKDSRGIITTTNVNLSSYVSYFTPSITGTAVRNQPTDNKVNLNGNGSRFNGSFGSQSNTLSVTYSIKEKSTSTVLESGSITTSSSGNNYTLSQKQVSNADYTKEYVATLTVTDKLNSVSTTINIPKGEPVFWWNKNKFDIKVNTQIKGTTTFSDKLIIQKNGNKGIYNASDYPIIRDHGNNNVTVDATGGVLYLGYQNTTGLNVLSGKINIDSSGNINYPNNNGVGVYWKEGSFGDQFKICPSFSGADDTNELQFKGAVGDSGTSPSLYNLMTLTGKSGNMWVKGNIKADDVIRPSTKGITACTGRSSTPNFDHQYPLDRANMRFDIVSSSMDSSGNKPATDGYVQTFMWDNSGAYDSQLFIPNGNSRLQFRSRAGGSWSNSWVSIPFLTDLPTINSNSNGYYIRFPNIKYQICWFYAGSKKVSGNSYANHTFTFPAAFSANPCVITSAGSDSTAATVGYIFCGQSAVSTTQVTIRCFNKDSSERWPILSYIALGPYS